MSARSPGRWSLLCLSLLALFVATPVFAQWTTDGVPVCTAAGTQSLVRAVPDGNGGAILVWRDQRTASDIYAQRLDADGNPLWAADGVPVATGSCNNPDVVSDGTGGAIVVWDDNRAAPRAIYAQRLDASTGASQWTANGVLLSGSELAFTPKVVSDGASGAIVCWYDNRGIYARRVDASGNPMWTAGGVGLCRQTLPFNRRTFQSLVSDGSGGAIAVWADDRDGFFWRTYARRVDATGDTLWAANGAFVPPAGKVTMFSMGLGDGAGGVIVGMEVALNQATDPIHVYVQRLDATGAVAAGWPANGVDLGESSSPGMSNSEIEMVTDGADGAIVAFQITGMTGTPGTIEAQRVTSAGVADWQGTVTTSEQGVAAPSAASDGAGGIIVAWQHRVGASFPIFWNVFAIRFTSSGVPVGWDPNGNVLCSVTNTYRAVSAASDGAGGAIVGWEDTRVSPANIYAGRVISDGTVDALFSLVNASSAPDRVWIEWYVGGTSAAFATVYRREPDTDWSTVATIGIDGTHRASYEDRDVEPGATYAYRLGVPSDGGEDLSGEVWLTVPSLPSLLALEGLWPNPSPGNLFASFSLPGGAPARLVLVDVSGRELFSREVGGLGAGSHRLRLTPESALRPGVYFLRLTQAGRTVSAKGIIRR